MRKRIITSVLTLTLILGTISGVYAAGDNSFSDVKETNWAYSYITQLVQKGGINGYPDKTFKPNNTMTAAEFVKTTVALIDEEKEKPLIGHWATNYFKTAVELEIVPEEMFAQADWNKPISRQKMGVIMERTAQLFLDEAVVTDTAKLNNIKTSIKDYSAVCVYCQDYIVQAVSRGLINGYSDGTFKPEKTATRAEATAMIIRLVEPSYRVFTAQTAPDPGVVATGTDLSDYINDTELVGILKEADINKYTVLKDGSKFYLEYVFQSDSSFFVKYKNYGFVDTLDKNGNNIDTSNPTNSMKDLVTQPFKGQLKDTAYFVFTDFHDNTAYIVPNTLK